MLNTPQTGMILVMEGLRDHWKQKDIDKLQKDIDKLQKDIDKLQKELRLLVAPDLIEKDPFKIELVAPEFQIDDIVLMNEILDLRYAKVGAKIFDNAEKMRILYKDKDGKEDLIEEELDDSHLCGDLEAEIYFFLRESSNLSNAEAGYNFRFAKQVLDTYCGIKIYRDSFRVKPYGC